ncbi:hypothetical protein KKB28_01145 [bacterium]|nr:hypothetical protein [bacterium]
MNRESGISPGFLFSVRGINMILRDAFPFHNTVLPPPDRESWNKNSSGMIGYISS